VKIQAVIPTTNTADFLDRVNKLTGGGIEFAVAGEVFKAMPV